MKTLLYLTTLFFVYSVVATLLLVSPYLGDNKNNRRNTLFLDKLDNAISRGKSSIFIKDLTDFEWEKVCVFSPYTSPEYVQETIGFDHNLPAMPELNSDGYSSLVFTLKNKESYYLAIPRSYGDVFNYSGCYENKNAKLVLNTNLRSCNKILSINN